MFVDLLFILLLAFVFSVFMTGPAGWAHPRDSSAISGTLFLLLLFGMVIWAVRAWTGPFGPELFGFAWIGPLVTGVILALLLLAVSAPAPRRDGDPASRSRSVLQPHEGPPGRAFGVFFWILMLALLALLVLGPA